MENRPKRSDLLWAALFGGLHLLVAGVYVQYFDITILGDTKVNDWDWFWQTLPLDALRTDLWQSLWFLHSQPPVLNLLGGLYIKAFYPHHLEALHVTNIVLGALICGLFYLIVVHFTNRRAPALGLSLLLTLNPSLYLFEAYVLYTVLTAFLVMLNLSCVLWYRQTRQPAALVVFILSLNLLILTRSVYHIILIPLALLFVWWLMADDRTRRLRTVFAGLLICLLSLGWFAKNSVLFGFFGASSWSGMGLWKAASRGDKLPQMEEYARLNVVEPMVVDLGAFAKPSAYEAYGFQKRSTIPVLAGDDYNNINIPDISARYRENARRLIAYAPQEYLHTVYLSYLQFSQPSSHFKHLSINSEEIPLHVWFYADYLEGGILLSRGQTDFGSFLFFLLPVSLVLYGVQFLRQWRRSDWRIAGAVRADSVLVWCAFLIVYTTAVGLTMEYGENDRFKFLIEFPLWIFVPVVLGRFAAHLWAPIRESYIFAWKRAHGSTQ